MTLTYVLMQYLRRNRLRSVMTGLAFALPMFVFVVAISFVVVLGENAAANEQELRLGVHHKTTLVNLLPEGMRRKIEDLDPSGQRITAVCGMRWFGGRVPDTQNVLTSLAADPDTFPIVYSDLGMTDVESDQWQRKRTAALVGSSFAQQYKWNTGERITLVSSVPPYSELEFEIIKIMTLPSRSNVMYFRRDYLDEALTQVDGEPDRCNIFWVKCKSAQALRELQLEIDAATANTPDETKSEDENAFINNFIQAMGNIPGLMNAMAVVVVFVISLVAGNTMMMSFRERTRELAVFKAIGFQSGRIFWIVISESVLLALFGSVIGIGLASLVLGLIQSRIIEFGPISALKLSPTAVWVSLAIALLVGLASGIVPAYQGLKLRTTDALRSLG